MSPETLHHLDEALQHLREHGAGSPELGIVLGSGLGMFAESLADRVVIPSGGVPHYPRSTVEGHKGELVFGTLGGKRVLAIRGRVHFYESGDVQTILFPIRVAVGLGVRTLIVTNAAGGINRTFVPGDLMIIADQINLTGEPLPPPLPPRKGPIEYYAPALVTLAKEVAAAAGIRVVSGVYAGVKGPSYETAAEIEMIHRLGGDAVGMSTVLETALAASLGVRILGISCITNKATGTGPAKLDHSEVTQVANRVRTQFSDILARVISAL